MPKQLTGKATEVRKLRKWRGDARLYKLDPPIPFDKVWVWGGDEEYKHDYEYIVISGVPARWTRSIAVYLSDKRATVIDERDPYKECHDKTNVEILAQLGYELVKTEKVKTVVAKPVRYLRLED